MKTIDIRVVESISEEIERVQNRIRARAYQTFIARTDNSDCELEDWLTAERELICILFAAIEEEEDRIVALIEIPPVNVEDPHIQVTHEDVLITVAQQGSAKEDHSMASERIAFGVIRFPKTIDPLSLRAEYVSGILKLTALPRTRTFSRSA